MRLTDRKLFVFLLSLCLVPVLPSCDDDDDDDDDNDNEPAAVTVAITDAPSDQILRSLIEIESIRLNRNNGDIADILTTPVQVDLAALQETAQILRLAVIPAGNYGSADVVVDLSAAEFVLAGQAGPATVLDSTGAAFAGPTTLRIEFNNPMQVDRGHNRALVLEFPIDEAVLVDAPANTVRVEPVLAAEINPQPAKPLLAFGRLVSASDDTNDIVVTLESIDGVALTEVTLEGDGETVYHVDGVPHAAGSGLTTLETMAPGTWVQIEGEIDGDAPEIDAEFVSAGFGTFNDGLDVVDGYVVDRIGVAGSDPVLTVLGRSDNAPHTVQQWNTAFTINTSFANTNVLRPGSSLLFDLDDVNIGQRVRVCGTLAGTTLDATTASSVLQIVRTRIFGTAQGPASANVLTMTLAQVETVPETSFDWTDSGTTPADPTNFDVAVGTLDNGLGIAAGTLIDATGFFHAIDDDSEDFTANRLTNLDDADVLLVIKDLSAVGHTVVTTANASSITFDISGTLLSGEIASIDRGLAGSTPVPTTPAPSVVPATGNFRGFVYDRDAGTVRAFGGFQAFSEELATALSASAHLASFSATGDLDTTTNQLTADRAIAVLD